ncbi:polymorphic toxin-type HINT domain-containing protein [Hymenobacter volaticus]|uniref:HINT domain-containing protein n=1 Tax=Hymenobacter volaticus TaxID=2932254 RepID=A0ABY4GDM5_9BACT|nr:polymorphic toxin-type HINT domain-containing protein [Hymenobacter volaticus]UOQ68851.1 HINT domain-containing protein [Hymenobacter volaticus]
MMGAKAGVRTALKAGTKVAAGLAKKKMAELALKSAALKNGLKAGVRSFAAKIPRLCVTACFPVGTPVAVEGGYKNIEDIQVGELVWSWHEETGNLALKPVLQTMQRESDALVELRLGADVVQATPEHPFWVNGNWKVAGELVVGDAVLRSDGLTMPVSEVVHHTEQPVTVYNFEVADWHTYLVSWWMFVVHNATICLAEIKRLLLGGRYLKEVEKITGRALHPTQLAELKKAIRSKKYNRLTKEATEDSRKEFNEIKDTLIKEWEQHTGQKWPTEKKQINIKETGKREWRTVKYDAHHLIYNRYGGNNEWWNIHPARSGVGYQDGIHKGLGELLFP